MLHYFIFGKEKYEKVCVVTAARSEYGLLRWLLRELQSSSSLQLQLLVTGSHLSSEYGFTYREIKDDGFQIDKKVEFLLSSSTARYCEINGPVFNFNI